MVRWGLFTPLCEPWLLLMHLYGSLDGSGQPFLSISGSLGLIFIRFGPHFEYFCMRKKANIITSTQQADATQPNKIKGTCDQFFFRETRTQWTTATQTTKQTKKRLDQSQQTQLHPSIHPSIHSSIHSSIQPSIKRVH